MDGYDATSYGRGFADVYDEWYHGVTDIEATVATLDALAGDGPVLELGVGTGRLAIPLARRSERRIVWGVDASPEMIEQLRSRVPPSTIQAVVGDMADHLPQERFTLVFAAYNTLFNLATGERQQACFSAVAERLASGGRFAVEAFVPGPPARDGDHLEIKTLAVDKIVLSISRHDSGAQLAEGQFVELSERDGVRLRPWSIRYSMPDELDAMAAAAGLVLESRWESFAQDPFSDTSPQHVSVYRRPG